MKITNRFEKWFWGLFVVAVLIGSMFAVVQAASKSNMTDYTCMSRCLNAGYSYGYCKAICSY